LYRTETTWSSWSSNLAITFCHDRKKNYFDIPLYCLFRVCRRSHSTHSKNSEKYSNISINGKMGTTLIELCHKRSWHVFKISLMCSLKSFPLDVRYTNQCFRSNICPALTSFLQQRFIYIPNLLKSSSGLYFSWKTARYFTTANCTYLLTQWIVWHDKNKKEQFLFCCQNKYYEKHELTYQRDFSMSNKLKYFNCKIVRAWTGDAHLENGDLLQHREVHVQRQLGLELVRK